MRVIYVFQSPQITKHVEHWCFLQTDILLTTGGESIRKPPTIRGHSQKQLVQTTPRNVSLFYSKLEKKLTEQKDVVCIVKIARQEKTSQQYDITSFSHNNHLRKKTPFLLENQRNKHLPATSSLSVCYIKPTKLDPQTGCCCFPDFRWAPPAPRQGPVPADGTWVPCASAPAARRCAAAECRGAPGRGGLTVWGLLAFIGFCLGLFKGFIGFFCVLWGFCRVWCLLVLLVTCFIREKRRKDDFLNINYMA